MESPQEKKSESIENENIAGNPQEVDEDLDKLTKILADLQKDRKESEKNEKILNNRNRILNHNEAKASKKLELENRNKENIERIRVNVLSNKERVEINKKKKAEHLKEQHKKIVGEYENSKKVLSEVRPNVIKRNKKDGEKAKNDRTEMEKIVDEKKQKFFEQRKGVHDLVQLEREQGLEKRKSDEMKKKLLLKKQLEEKIQKEIELKNALDMKISSQQKKNEEIQKRIQDINDNMAKAFK